MKRFPKFAVLALTFYFAFVLVGNFHIHTAGSESGKLQCHLCQVTQMSADFNGNWQIDSEISDFGVYQTDVQPLHIDSLPILSLGRAPPLS